MDRDHRRCFGLLLASLLSVACAEKEGPFTPVLEGKEASGRGSGYGWFHHKPGTFMPGARYEAGYDNNEGYGLGLCRARHEGAVEPGKIVLQKCVLTAPSGVTSVDDFDVLVARKDGLWHMPAGKVELSRALVVGAEKDGSPSYACVARHVTGFFVFSKHHGYHPGKYAKGTCTIASDGEARTVDEFFVLAAPKAQAVNAEPASAVASSCLQGEVACACEKYTGCAMPGQCLCTR